MNYQSAAGRELGRRFGIDVVPSFVVFGKSGKVIATFEGTPRVPLSGLREALRAGRFE